MQNLESLVSAELHLGHLLAMLISPGLYGQNTNFRKEMSVTSELSSICCENIVRI